MRRLVSTSNPNFSCSVPILRRRRLHIRFTPSVRAYHHARCKHLTRERIDVTQRAHRRVDDARRPKYKSNVIRVAALTRFPPVAFASHSPVARAPERRFRLASAANKLHALLARHRGGARAVTARRRRRRRRRTRSQHRGAAHACLGRRAVARAPAARGRATRGRCRKRHHLARPRARR